MVQVHQQRRVARHHDVVGISLQAGHESRFANGTAQIAEAAVFGDGVFADENFRTRAIILVEVRGVAHEKFRRVVEMFIHDVRLRVIGITALPMVGDELDFRIFRVNRIHEQRPAFAVGRAAVFVADLQIFQVERCGMSGLGAHRAPDGIGRAIGIFNRIQRVLHPLAQAIERDGFFVRHADIDAKQRLGTEVFGKLQIFVIAQAVRGVVTPDVPERRARIQVANGVLPMIHVREVVALHPAAAGKAHEGGMQSLQRFREVSAQAVILPGLVGQERNHVEKQNALAAAGNFQLRLRVTCGRRERERAVFPTAGDIEDLAAGERFAVRAD